MEGGVSRTIIRVPSAFRPRLNGPQPISLVVQRTNPGLVCPPDKAQVEGPSSAASAGPMNEEKPQPPQEPARKAKEGEPRRRRRGRRGEESSEKRARLFAPARVRPFRERCSAPCCAHRPAPFSAPPPFEAFRVHTRKATHDPSPVARPHQEGGKKGGKTRAPPQVLLLHAPYARVLGPFPTRKGL